MPKGIYKRKKKAGRPKGSRNKKNNLTTEFVDFEIPTNNPKLYGKSFEIKEISEPTEPPTFLSRLEAATVKYEQAINDAITALKGQ